MCIRDSHISFLDPINLIILAHRNKKVLNFMAKDELFKNALFSWFLKKMGAFSVKRGDGAASLKKAADILEAVSYTHLDVYKRQLCTCDNSLEYSADVAMLLLYGKVCDNIKDESFFKRLGYRLLLPFAKSKRKKAAKKHPVLDVYKRQAYGRPARGHR